MTDNHRHHIKTAVTFLVSLLVGTAYAVLLELICKPLATFLVAWPLCVCLCWWLFRTRRLLRCAGFLAVLPVSLLAFELLQGSRRPAVVADRFKTLDRSHYVPNFQGANPDATNAVPGGYGWGLEEIRIGADGFRADPASGAGNPERCPHVLIGDSMIYGSGLPYAQTLGPVLGELGVPACVFGVTGNSPVDYLATLKFVEPRIEPGARVVFYLYAYNDFVSLSKYSRRGFLALANRFPDLVHRVNLFDAWRQTTFLYNLFRSERARPPKTLWTFDVGRAAPIRLLHTENPADYRPPPSLSSQQRAALGLFLKGADEIVQGHDWRVSIVIHPDFPELFANLARGAAEFADLDPRRAEAARMIREAGYACEDVSRYLYERTRADGKNPYFEDNRHFSAYGTRLLAEYFKGMMEQPAL